VDKYQTVAFDGNRYSVPRSFAYQTVSVKGFVDRVVIVAAGAVIATHSRCLEHGTLVLDPLHYLATLGRKPGALDHTPVYRDWKLPACFATLRAELEQLHGAEGGARRFVRVLQLLGEHPLDRVRRAVEACQLEHVTSAEAVLERTKGFARVELAANGSSPTVLDSIAASQVDVPLPDLSQFNQLLGHLTDQDDWAGGARNQRADASAAEGQNHVVFA
jgi:hypothetical protein